MNKFLISLAAVVAITFGGVASAGHPPSSPMLIEEGAVKVMRGSFCAEESAVISIFDKLAREGMDSSVVLFEEYIRTGMCINTNIGTATIVRLVAQVGTAIAVEVVLPNGNSLYFIIADGKYITEGEPI